MKPNIFTALPWPNFGWLAISAALTLFFRGHAAPPATSGLLEFLMLPFSSIRTSAEILSKEDPPWFRIRLMAACSRLRWPRLKSPNRAGRTNPHAPHEVPGSFPVQYPRHTTCDRGRKVQPDYRLRPRFRSHRSWPGRNTTATSVATRTTQSWPHFETFDCQVSSAPHRSGRDAHSRQTRDAKVTVINYETRMPILRAQCPSRCP